MPISDEHWRFLVEELLGVTPERCDELVERIERRHPQSEQARALARSFRPRAIMSGFTTGLTGSITKASALALLEERGALRNRVMLRACLHRLDDRHFFARDDWPRCALGIDQDAGALAVLAPELIRTIVRTVIVRATRRMTAFVPSRISTWASASAGALFSAIELERFARIAIEEREQTFVRGRPPAELEAVAKVVPLPTRSS